MGAALSQFPFAPESLELDRQRLCRLGAHAGLVACAFIAVALCSLTGISPLFVAGVCLLPAYRLHRALALSANMLAWWWVGRPEFEPSAYRRWVAKLNSVQADIEVDGFGFDWEHLRVERYSRLADEAALEGRTSLLDSWPVGATPDPELEFNLRQAWWDLGGICAHTLVVVVLVEIFG